MGTVKGDFHDIGKRIVCLILEREGYEVIDIGIDVSKEKYLSAIKQEKPDIVGMSALLTTTMIYMSEIIKTVKKAKLRQVPRLIIGGAPVTQSFSDEIRADGYAPDAISAAELIQRLLKK